MTTQKLIGWSIELFGIVAGYLAGTANRKSTIQKLHKFVSKVTKHIADEY